MKIVKILFLFSFLTSIFISCSSIPKKEYDEASILREKAIKYDLSSYAEETLTIAESSYSAGSSIVENQNKNEYKNAKNYLTNAINNYQIIIDTAIPQYARDLKSDVLEEKLIADEINSAQNAPEIYEDGDLLFLNGSLSLAKSDYEDSIQLFNEARKKFNEAYLNTKSIYERSKTALKELEKKVIEIDNIANEFQDENITEDNTEYYDKGYEKETENLY